VPFPQFRERALASLTQTIEVIGQLMPSDRLSRGFAQTGRHAPLFHCQLIPIVPFSPLKGVQLVKTLECSEMEQQSADRVRLGIMQIVELRHGEALYWLQNRVAHPG